MLKRFLSIGLTVAALAVAAINTSAHAENIGKAVGVVITGATASVAVFPPASAAIMTVASAAMLPFCEVTYRTTGNKCGDPAPITAPGYNQLTRQVPMADGHFYGDRAGEVPLRR